MYRIILVTCLVGLSLSRPSQDKPPKHETALTIDESIMKSLNAKGIRPSGIMVDQQTGHMITELDMVTTPEQYEMLHGIEDNASGKSKRKAYGGAIYRWTDKTIPYEFNHAEYEDYQETEIKEAMDVYMKETCLVFRPATSKDVNKIYFQNGGGGCNSQLGMVNGSQAVNLDNNGCRFMGLYFHEIGHAIGLVHEHQLPDRGDYVTVLWSNVDPPMKSAFFKYSESLLDRFEIPYDITSIMHYGINAFGKLGAQTIKPHDYALETRVGRVFWKMMSFSDVKIVNKMYNCDEKCGNVQCPKEGFVNKECKCVTPKSYYESHCYNVQPEDKCLEWAVQGECQANAAWMGYNCRKACDECPKYGVAKKPNSDKCHDLYYDDAQCKAWAGKGYCDKYESFMKRQCTKTCGACGKFGKCSNTNWRDADCDFWAKGGECQNNPVWMKLQCADSCDSCGYREPGACENIDDDAKCEKAAFNNECDDIRNIERAVYMQKNCAKACSSCNFNKGNCKNSGGSDDECEKLAAQGDCDANPSVVKRKCQKACNSCDFGIKGNCKNPLGDDAKCENWHDIGECEGNPGWMKYNCARDCNSCEWLDPNACYNKYGVDKDCDKWEKEGECQNNPSWMKDNCAKACGICGDGENQLTTKTPVVPTKPSTGGGGAKCVNKHSNCQMWAETGQCESGADYMLNNCFKACRPDECGEGNTGTGIGTGGGNCVDEEKDCAEWHSWGHCETNSSVKKACPKSCGVC
ncbi:zinc metalloproteinase nas-14-like isoform X2 [Lineus longissimus]|uniref:zinc metalloproteinase nas-14-like isoform X2 n=1 Tax=Lineus longissimus TaxID=88925 RepID=UPI002B4D408F